jgi:cell division protein FtsQ
VSTRATRRPAAKKKSTRATQARRPRASIDPRIRERRVAVVRAQGRRRLRWVVAIVVLGILGAAAYLLTHSALLDVDHVRITPTQHVSAAQVRLVSGVKQGDPILFVDLGAVAERVERLPWVDKAHVGRRLTGEVDIRVTERSPAAWARRTADQVALVDARGRVLADAPEAPAQLPDLGAVATLPPPGGRIDPHAAVGVIGKLPAELRMRVARVVADGGAVTLALRDGPEVRFGSPDQVPAKARAALAVLGTITGPPPAYVDVRVPTAPVTG